MSLQLTRYPRSRAKSSAPAEADISIAIMHPGNRLRKLAIPLIATEMDVVVRPPDPYEFDVLLMDNADRKIARWVLQSPLHRSKVVYRMRGDLYRELETWQMHPVKKWAATEFLLPHLDGAIAVNEPLAEKLRSRARLNPVGVASLAIHAEDWPRHNHRDRELRAVTLTNANYVRKIQPIIEWAPTVEAFLADQGGGRWLVGGDGLYDYLLEHELREYEYIHYGGFLDAERALAESNLMLHPSNLDGVPNSILEAIASRLPVISNDFEAFTSFDGPIQIAHDRDGLEHFLYQATDPNWRERLGQMSLDYVRVHHTPEAVGQAYVRYFQELLGHA